MGGTPFQSRLKKLKKRFTAPSEELQDKTFIDASVLQHIINRRNPDMAFKIFKLDSHSIDVDLLADKYATELLNLVSPLLPPLTSNVEATSSTAYNVVWVFEGFNLSNNRQSRESGNHEAHHRPSEEIEQSPAESGIFVACQAQTRPKASGQFNGKAERMVCGKGHCVA